MRTIIVPAIILVLAGCGSEGDEPAGLSQLHAGELRYTATAADGQLLLRGKLALSFPDDSTVTGEWSIRWAPGADSSFQVGPQIGNGSLAGRRIGDSLVIDLNPGFMDNNVILFASSNPTNMAGRWSWSTIAGPRTGGLFWTSQDRLEIIDGE